MMILIKAQPPKTSVNLPVQRPFVDSLNPATSQLLVWSTQRFPFHSPPLPMYYLNQNRN